MASSSQLLLLGRGLLCCYRLPAVPTGCTRPMPGFVSTCHTEEQAKDISVVSGEVQWFIW
jgi:hypothetical protein